MMTLLPCKFPPLLNSPDLCSLSSPRLPGFSATRPRTVLLCFFKDNSYSHKKNRSSINGISASEIPARDRVIDFGKYKGKMLGTLPFTYLRWVSKNLRARDFEEWANLADQVLQDPVYRDRLEWECAEKVLNGDVLTSSPSSTPSSSSSSAVTALLEISRRFGWDNEDKVGWSRVKFELLGTSKSGRIPRISSGESRRGLRRLKGQEETVGGRGKREESDEGGQKQQGGEGAREKREERRDRLRLRSRRRLPIKTASDRLKAGKDRFDTMWMNGEDREADRSQKREAEVYNPFPGREALFRKVLSSKHDRRSTF